MKLGRLKRRVSPRRGFWFSSEDFGLGPSLMPVADFSAKGWRVLPFLIFSIVVVLIIFYRLIGLQLLYGASYREAAERNALRLESIPAERGLLLDRMGEVIAQNKPGFSLYLSLDSEDQIKTEKTLRALSTLLGWEFAELNERTVSAREQDLGAVLIDDRLSHADVIKIEANREKLPGLSIQVTPWRSFPKGEIFATVVGHLGQINQEELSARSSSGYLPTDRVGKVGLEAFYEDLLAGERGKRLLEVDALGSRRRVLDATLPKSGKTLVLTLDARLQERVFEVLRERVALSQAKSGAVVVQNPKNGEILALLSYPAFDPNIFEEAEKREEVLSLLKDPQQPLFNRAIAGQYPAGSTFKLVVATAALEEGVVGRETLIRDTGVIRIGEYSFANWRTALGLAPQGLINLPQAIAHSNDIFFYIVGGGYAGQKGLGVEKIVAWAKRFGLGQKTAIDLTGEKEGFLPDPAWKEKTQSERWFLGDTYNLSIGQGSLLVTPLQINQMTAAVANGGKLFRPFLVSRVLDEMGREVRRFEPTLLSSVPAQSSNLEVVREGMRRAVLEGADRLFRSFPVAVASKTGTAETDRSGITHAWYSAFAPYENPEIVVTVFLEEGGSGALDAQPVAHQILSFYFSQRR